MKLWKRLTAGAVALTMSASVWAFAACGDPNQGDPNQGGNNNNQNQGGNNNNQGEDVSAIVSALKEQQLVSATVKYSMTEHDESEHTYNDADGNKIKDYYSYNRSIKNSMEMKVNIANGNMDGVMYSEKSRKEQFADGETEDYMYEDYIYKNKSISYVFLRNWNAFSYDIYDSVDEDNQEPQVEEVTDWRDVVLEYGGKVTESMPMEFPEEAMGMYFSYEPAVNILLLNLASAADAVKIESGKATIDINKLVDNALSDATSALQSFTDKTTVGELLDNAIIAKYLSAIFNIFTVDEVKELLELYLEGSEMEEMINSILAAVEPDANSTTYQYIVKLVKSAELYNLVNGIVGGGALPAGTLDNITLGFIMQMVLGAMGGGKVEVESAARAVADAGEGVDYLALAKAYVSELSKQITATELKIKSVGYHDGYNGDFTSMVTFRNFKMEYTLNADNTIASQKVSFDGTQTGVTSVWAEKTEQDENGEFGFVFVVTNETSEISLEASIEYSSTEATLIDISGCTVEKEEYKVPDGTHSNTREVYLTEKEYEGSVTLTASVTIKDGIVTAISVQDDKGNVLATEDGQYFDVEVTAYTWQDGEQTQVTFTENLYVEMNYDYTYDGELFWVDLTIGNSRTNESFCQIIWVQCKSIFYSNTVAGVLNGTDWTEIAD